MRQKEDIPDHPDQAIHLPRHEASGRWLSASPGAVRSVYPNLVIGVNDKLKRRSLAELVRRAEPGSGILLAAYAHAHERRT